MKRAKQSKEEKALTFWLLALLLYLALAQFVLGSGVGGQSVLIICFCLLW